MTKVIETLVPWAAGFFEGEGWAGINRTTKKSGKTYLSLGLRVNQNTEAPLRHFRDIVGAGLIRGPNGPYGNQKNPHYRWVANGPVAREVLSLLRPFLLTKGEQVDRVLKELDEYEDN